MDLCDCWVGSVVNIAGKNANRVIYWNLLVSDVSDHFVKRVPLY